MSFDKTKVMKNAERFLSQGKIRAAINEYKLIAENDPNDFSSLNILGDLYIKNSEKKEAVNCFTKVADYYNKQGFAQKAIAIYNKISRIEPHSTEVAAKLAQLYHLKGSVAEARVHYTTLAENFKQKGKTSEALETWKKIAELDPRNTDIYVKIAESYIQENLKAEAAASFVEAGLRFSQQEKYEDALAAFSRALELNKNDLRALNGFVKAQISIGDADEASKTLESILEEQPYNRDILYLLVECYLDMNKPAEAEKAVIKLVEQEPANYPKYLDLVEIYLKNHDLDSATRMLSISAEYLLVGGQAEEFLKLTNEILARNPEQINALRLLVRYYGWQRDEGELRTVLERLAEVARNNNAVEDERFALLQLVLSAPQETGFARRLQELNLENGFAQDEFLSENSKLQNASAFSEAENFAMAPEFASIGESSYENEAETNFSEFAFADKSDFFDEATENFYSTGYKETDFAAPEKEFAFDYESRAEEESDYNFSAEEFSISETNQIDEPDDLKIGERVRLQKEIEGVEFYIAQGYGELAAKTLDALELEFGNRKEFEDFRVQLNAAQISEKAPDFQTIDLTSEELPSENFSETTNETVFEEAKFATEETKKAPEKFESFDDFSDDFETKNFEAEENEDYETHYHLAIAYKEMGLMEEAIREFQNAINLVKVNDGTRRFFQSANLLGHCFMEKNMPNLALMWYKRVLEVNDLEDEERQAIYYEIGNAYETGGDVNKAKDYFEMLYGENVDYRDVSERLVFLQESMTFAG